MVAAVPAVRAALLPFQRRFAADGRGAVLAGRDVGTVVCPDADLQAVRHRQRSRSGRGGATRSCGRAATRLYTRRFWTSCASVTAAMRTRAVAPMRIAPDAWVLDTTALDARGRASPRPCDHIAGRACHGRAPPSTEPDVRTCNPNPGPLAGRCPSPCVAAPFWSRNAGSHPSHRAAALAGRFRRDARRDAGLEHPPRRHRRPRHRGRASTTTSVIVDVGLKSEGRVPLKEFGTPRPAARGPGRRPCRGLSSSGSRTRAARSSSAARRRGARRAGTGSSAPSTTPARSRATSSAGSRAASPSISAVPWPSCRAARSTSGRCATSAR